MKTKMRTHLPTKDISQEDWNRRVAHYLDMMGEPTEEDLEVIRKYDEKKGKKKG